MFAFLKNAWKNVVTAFTGIDEQTLHLQDEHYKPGDELYSVSPHVVHHVHTPGYAGTVELVLEESDEVATLTPQQLYNKRHYQKNKEVIRAKQAEYRAKKKAAAASILSKEEAEEEAYKLLKKWEQHRKASNKYHAKKRAERIAAGEIVRSSRKLNLGVTPSKHGQQAYSQAYYQHTKQAGNTHTTFSGSSKGYGYGTPIQD